MAIAVLTTASNTATVASSITVAKPTGLAEDDLMVAVICSYDGTGTISTETGWTSVAHVNNARDVRIFWKIATAGDVAASDFTFDTSEIVSNIAGAILRITGYATTSGEEIMGAEADSDIAVNSATISLETTLAPNNNGTLFVMGFVAADAGGGVATVGSYALSDGATTFTELFDTSEDAGSVDPVLAAAYGIQTTATTLTTFGATISQSREDHYGAIIAVQPLTNASVSLDALSLTGTVNTLTAIGGANVTLDQIALTATPNDVSAVEATPKWSNTDKSSPSSFTNTDKS